MAKGQKRSSREARKPKAEKPKPAAPPSPFAAAQLKTRPAAPPKAGKK
jgi:hypothetical protein